MLITSFFIEQKVRLFFWTEMENNSLRVLEATIKHVESQHKSILYHKSSMVNRRKAELKDHMDLAISVLEQVYEKYTNGLISEENAKKEAMNYLRRFRYDNKIGYFWVNNMAKPLPKLILHPTIPEVEGSSLDEPKYRNALDDGSNLLQKFVDETEETGEAYIHYKWPKPPIKDKVIQQPKISFVKRFKPWSWIIGTGVYIDDIEKDVQDRIDTVIADLNSSLVDQRVGKSGYFFIFSEKQDVLVHPNLANKKVSGLTNPATGKELFKELMEASSSPSRSMNYIWDKPGDIGNYTYAKKAYIAHYEHLDWYICSSVYIEELDEKISSLLNNLAIFFSIFFAIAILLALFITRSVINPLNRLVSAIRKTDADGIPVDNIPYNKIEEIKLLSDTIRGMISSISESRRQLVDSESKFRGLVESSSDIIWEVDDKGKYLYLSPKAKSILGYKTSDFKDKSLFDFMPNNQSNLVRGIFISSLKQGVSFEIMEHELIHKDGNAVVLETTGVPSFNENGEVIGYRGVSRDITKRKLDEKELQARTEELFATNEELTTHKNRLLELVEERTDELNKSLVELKRTQRHLVETEKMAALGGLVAGVAHEINTPIGACLTAASYLRDKTRDVLQSHDDKNLTKGEFNSFINSAIESADIIQTNVERASTLIHGFKQVAVDQTYEELRVFKIREYIDEILLSVHSKFKNTQYNIVVNCPKDFEVNIYPGALSQILTNFLMNSLIHGFEDQNEGTINIDVSHENEIVKILYSDNGCGIPKENIERIYEPFFTTKRGTGGSGLGLQIVYNLISQTLKGKIRCTSSIGNGAKFEMEFPGCLEK